MDLSVAQGGEVRADGEKREWSGGYQNVHESSSGYHEYSYHISQQQGQ